jgi:hypothetical protein
LTRAFTRVRLPRWFPFGSAVVRRRTVARQVLLTAFLVAVSVLLAFGMGLIPAWIPPAAYLLVILLGAFELRMVGMIILCAALAAQIAILLFVDDVEMRPGTVLVLVAGIVVALGVVRARDRLGLQGAAERPDARRPARPAGGPRRIPPLPAQWRVDSVVRPPTPRRSRATSWSRPAASDGQPARDRPRRRLRQGAGGGGAVPAALRGLRRTARGDAAGGVLPAANTYLLGQAGRRASRRRCTWRSGWTAGVLGLDGRPPAGRPPARRLGPDRDDRHPGGPALGILAEPGSPRTPGVLAAAGTR